MAVNIGVGLQRTSPRLRSTRNITFERAKVEGARPQERRSEVAGRVGATNTERAPSHNRTYEVQRWLHKKLSISRSGRNFPGAPIPRLFIHLSRSRNPLLS